MASYFPQLFAAQLCILLRFQAGAAVRRWLVCCALLLFPPGAVWANSATQEQNPSTQAQFEKGVQLADLGQPREALAVLKTAFAQAQGENDSLYMARIQGEIGMAAHRLNQNEQAVEAFLQGLVIAEKIGDATLQCAILCKTIYFYIKYKQFEQAEAFLARANTLAETHNAPEMWMEIFIQRGIMARRKKENKQALAWYQKALVIARELDKPGSVFDILINLATAYSELGNQKEALALMEEAYVMDTLPDSRYSRTLVGGQLGWLHLRNGNIPEGLRYLNNSLKWARELEHAELEMWALKSLARACKTQGDYQKAYDYYAEFVQLLEANLENEKTEAIAEMAVRYESERKEEALRSLTQTRMLEKEVYEARLDEQRLFLVSLLMGSALLILLVAGGFWYFRIQLRNREQLAQSKLEIGRERALMEGELAERKRLAQELHDGLGSSLASIRMKIGGLMEEGEQDPALQQLVADIGQACRETRSISHNLMAEQVVNGDLVQALETLVEQANAQAQTRISLDVFPEAALRALPERLAHHSFRMVQELVRNALRHARANAVRLDVLLEADGLHILVEDDGKGFSDADLAEGGKGLESVRARVESLQGDFSYDTHPRRGSAFMIRVPIYQTMKL